MAGRNNARKLGLPPNLAATHGAHNAILRDAAEHVASTGTKLTPAEAKALIAKHAAGTGAAHSGAVSALAMASKASGTAAKVAAHVEKTSWQARAGKPYLTVEHAADGKSSSVTEHASKKTAHEHGKARRAAIAKEGGDIGRVAVHGFAFAQKHGLDPRAVRPTIRVVPPPSAAPATKALPPASTMPVPYRPAGMDRRTGMPSKAEKAARTDRAKSEAAKPRSTEREMTKAEAGELMRHHAAKSMKRAGEAHAEAKRHDAERDQLLERATAVRSSTGKAADRDARVAKLSDDATRSAVAAAKMRMLAASHRGEAKEYLRTARQVEGKRVQAPPMKPTKELPQLVKASGKAPREPKAAKPPKAERAAREPRAPKPKGEKGPGKRPNLIPRSDGRLGLLGDAARALVAGAGGAAAEMITSNARLR